MTQRFPLRLTLGTVAVASMVSLLASCGRARVAPAGGRDQVGEHRLVVDTIPLWYRVAGQGSREAPVVFLHGGPGQGSEHFERLVGRSLEPSLRMVYLDQRASGRSGRGDASQYTMERLVSDIDTLRRALGVEKLALVGHSFGGTLALEYAARFPERVRAVVFAGGLWDATRQGALRCEYANRTFAGVAASVVGDTGATRAAQTGNCSWMGRLPRARRDSLDVAVMFPDPRVAARLDSIEVATGRRNTGDLGRALGRSLGQYRFTQFDRLTMPVLVIAGRADGAAGVSGSRELVAKLPNATFLEFEQSGHFMYLDETSRFAREVTAFLRGSER